tara:strand:- start:11567 stop:12037 length:471 start_codon:yes stop_codon:yes gene_type:complete
MILIAHRGNINGPDQTNENSPSYIMEAIKRGYQVELDVHFIENKWFLGHDTPDYQVEMSFLLNDNLWCHAKNHAALEHLLGLGARCFWHQKDDYTLTSDGFIWAYPGKPLTQNSICVMPEWFPKDYQSYSQCYGICSDYVEDYNEESGKIKRFRNS